MNTFRQLKPVAWLVSILICFHPLKGLAEDIDIFVGSSAGAADNPNILIVLDNTSNWARQAQQWPGNEQQGQSEVDAIKTVINETTNQVNVGLFSFNTDGTAGQNDGGKVRYHISTMDSTNKANLGTLLTGIYDNVTDNTQKRSSGAPYGYLMSDVYNYFAGLNAYATPSHVLVDPNGYTTPYSTFKSPLSSDRNCAKNFVILISNPDQSGPTDDDAAGTLLSSIGGDATQIGLPNFTSTSTTVSNVIVGQTNKSGACYADAASCTTAQRTYATTEFPGKCATDPFSSADPSTWPAFSDASGTSTCSCSTEVTETTACDEGTLRYSVIGTLAAGRTDLGYDADCVSNINSCSFDDDYAAECTGTGITCACDESSYTTTSCGTGKKKFMVYKTRSTTTATNLGYTSSCYADQASCATTDYTTQCASYDTCACGTPTTNSSACTTGKNYVVSGSYLVTTNTATGTYTTDTATYNADEWARHMYQVGIPVAGSDNQKVNTYTIDVYNAQQNATHTKLMMSMAKAGGGKYFNATNKAAILKALREIIAEIVSVNSTFASASLPISATNRSQNENQVFIGMFRPDPAASPRWFGNLKRYQLIKDAAGNIDLADVNSNVAINNVTGFISDCTTSWWTSDSGTYWQNYAISPSPAGKCPTTSFDKWSDSPDGPHVEKGAVAEVIRKGNNPPTTDTAPTWSENRTLYTYTGSATPAAFNVENTGLTETLVKWVRGQDTEDENGNGALGLQTPANATETRASLHGDVVHSKPLPVNYGGTTGVVVYYGANDGTLRAVDAETAQEKWALVAPEFHSKLDRLRTQTPTVCYPNNPAYDPATRTCGTDPDAPVKREYFWDGSIGLYQPANNTAWIFPTMRRGGRMIYALDVTTPSAPTIKWRFGCPNASNDTGCTAGASGIGQTWSIPNIAFLHGWSAPTPATESTSAIPAAPIAVVGGGYDSCEDQNSLSPTGCSKGNVVYVLNADTGAVIKSFPTLRSVPSDVALIDMNFDGSVDYGYVGDTGGNLYRISFSTYDSVTGTYTALPEANWVITRVAYTAGGGRKFLFTPALFGGKGRVWVALGSGDREHPLNTDYPVTTPGPVVNKFYVYRDCHSTTPESSTNSGGDDLDDAVLMNTSSSTAPASCTAAKTLADNCTENKGWSITLNNGTGEQTVTSAVISGGMVTFSTNRAIPAVAGTCSTPLGEARGYWLDLFNGSGAIGVFGSCGGTTSTTFIGGGMPPSPVIGTVSIGGVPTTVVIGAAKKSGEASSPISPQKAMSTNLPSRRRVYQFIKGDN